jgi:hypothetical protein
MRSFQFKYPKKCGKIESAERAEQFPVEIPEEVWRSIERVASCSPEEISDEVWALIKKCAGFMKETPAVGWTSGTSTEKKKRCRRQLFNSPNKKCKLE